MAKFRTVTAVRTAAELIKQYVDLRDTKTAMAKEFAEKIAPYDDALAAIESTLADEINKLDGQAIKTRFGTAYRQVITSFKVVDRDVWFKFATNGHLDMLTANVAKDAIAEYTENNELPPGLTRTVIYKTNVRSTD